MFSSSFTFYFQVSEKPERKETYNLPVKNTLFRFSFQITKGQLILKTNCQAEDSSKKRIK